jgi:multidrug transporter EmrE-like cation transporter
MTTKSLLLLLASAGAATTSTAIFRSTLKDRFAWKGSVPELIKDVFGLLSNVGFLTGLAVFILTNLLWLLVLGSQKLSVAYPIQIGLVVLFNAVISAWFFAESMSVQGYAGLAFIVLGVFLIVR